MNDFLIVIRYSRKKKKNMLYLGVTEKLWVSQHTLPRNPQNIGMHVVDKNILLRRWYKMSSSSGLG